MFSPPSPCRSRCSPLKGSCSAPSTSAKPVSGAIASYICCGWVRGCERGVEVEAQLAEYRAGRKFSR
eukprot:6185513-Pleurochrysis_carterae.AAC.2